MESQPATRFSIEVFGDGIVDEYLIGQMSGNRFTADRHIYKFGGAYNVVDNIRSLTLNCHVRLHTCMNPDSQYHLTRLIMDDKVLFEIANQPESFDRSVYESYFAGNNDRQGLVISDYNKGAINQPFSKNAWERISKHRYDFCVVDSRYGTYNPQLLDISRMKILHATRNEINLHDLNRFSYIFHTHDKDPVLVYKNIDGPLTQIASIEVPNTPVVDSAGAGDVFVAAIASRLANRCNEAWDDNFMVSAASNAVALCQQSLGELGVVTVKPLE